MERGQRHEVALGAHPELGLGHGQDLLQSAAGERVAAGDGCLVAPGGEHSGYHVTTVETPLGGRVEVDLPSRTVHEIEPVLDLGDPRGPYRHDSRDRAGIQIVVGVEEHHDVATDCGEASVEGRSMAAVSLPKDSDDTAPVFADDVTRVVQGGVVDDYDLGRRVRLRERAVDALSQVGRVVEVGDDDRDEGNRH